MTPNRGCSYYLRLSIIPITTTSPHTYTQATKHVDLASIEAGLLPLARLVIADAHETAYSVTAEGAIQVPRFNAVDKYVCAVLSMHV